MKFYIFKFFKKKVFHIVLILFTISSISSKKLLQETSNTTKALEISPRLVIKEKQNFTRIFKLNKNNTSRKVNYSLYNITELLNWKRGDFVKKSFYNNYNYYNQSLSNFLVSNNTNNISASLLESNKLTIDKAKQDKKLQKNYRDLNSINDKHNYNDFNINSKIFNMPNLAANSGKQLTFPSIASIYEIEGNILKLDLDFLDENKLKILSEY